jgi:type IV pilus assembly protein PilV
MNRATHAHIRSRAGFSLLEVMVALLIFSLGLIGLAALLMLSVKTNYAATLRTQATFLAQSMSERMRANIIGVWNGSYDGKWTTAPAASCDPTAKGCSPSDLASWDVSAWVDAVQQSLPNATAEVACKENPIFAPTDFLSQPPYQGTCTIRLGWNETVPQGTVDSSGNTSTGQQTFAWVFTP